MTLKYPPQAKILSQQVERTEIDLSSGDLTLDVAGDIILDADGADVSFRDGGTGHLSISNSSNDAVITSLQSDNDMIIKDKIQFQTVFGKWAFGLGYLYTGFTEFIQKMSEIEEMIQPNRLPSLMNECSMDFEAKAGQDAQVASS